MFIAQSPADLPDVATMRSMSGLEFMYAIERGEISLPPIGGVMNYTLDSIEPGKAVFRGTPQFAHLNPMGGVHGGWYGTLLDSCLGCAVMTTVPQGSSYTTLEYKVNLNRAIPVGIEILASAWIDHAGRSTGTAHGEIRGAIDGKLYATGSTTCLIMKLPEN